MNNYYVSIFLNNHTFKQHGSLAPVIFPRALFILLSIFHISQNLSLEQISVKLPFVKMKRQEKHKPSWIVSQNQTSIRAAPPAPISVL